MKCERLSTLRSQFDESGQVLVFLVVALVVLLGMVALAVDVGMLMGERTKLQAVADASALAAAQDLPDEGVVDATAVNYAALNHPGKGLLVDPAEVKIGIWDGSVRTFYPDSQPVNAVEVYVRRREERGNAVPLIFARVLGWNRMDVSAHAIATGSSEDGVRSRFILDEEMFDSDVPEIENIAIPLKDAGEIDNIEDVISDLDGDWIIDLHKYVTPCCSFGEPTTLELPTGQVGDEGIFDMANADFPFADDAISCSEATIPASADHPCSFTDFLNYQEDSSSWRYDLIPKEWLDPLVGVSTVNDASAYPGFVDDKHCQASPVYKSDVSELNPVAGSPAVDLSPAVNALGWRRGLVIFKIVGVGTDPDGPGGSVLPNLRIQICDPATALGPGGIASVRLGQGMRYRLVD
jgi:hypothetical protein